MPAYYKQFDVVLIDSDGIYHPMPGETISVYNVTAAASLGTLVADANGVIAAGTLGATAEDVVEFSHATRPGLLRYVLKSTAAEADESTDNIAASFIVEDEVATTTDSETVRLYVADTAQPDLRPQYIGNGKVGTNLVPYKVNVSQTARVYAISQDTDLKLSTTDFSQAEFIDVDVTVADRSIHPIFDRYADATTTSTAAEDLWTDPVGTGLLSVNGDKIEAQYTLVYAANANSKRVYVDFGGTKILDSTVTENGTAAEVEVSLIRVSDTVVRYQTCFTSSNVAAVVTYGEITGLDLTGAYNLVLGGRTVTSAGDFTAKMAHALFIPAAYEPFFLMMNGEILTMNGDQLTFNP